MEVKYLGNEDLDTLFIMTYTLNSGIRNTVPLSVSQINEWIICFKEDSKFITTIGKEHFGLNSKSVADFKVHNKFSEHRKAISSIQNSKEEDDLKEAYERKFVLIKVDCQCGTTYITESPFKRTRWKCSKCKEDIFLMTDGLIDTNKGKAYYMTNKNI